MNTYTLIALLTYTAATINAQVLVPFQSEEFPIYSYIDSNKYSIMDLLLSNDIELLTELEPLIEQNDPWANYVYGRCLYNMVSGNKIFVDLGMDDTLYLPEEEIRTLYLLESIEYLEKAAAQKINLAHIILMEIYTAEEFGLIDYERALHHLHEGTKHADNFSKSRIYGYLSSLYLPIDNATGINPSFPIVEYDIDKGLEYLIEAEKYDRFIKYWYLGETHEKYGRYDKAVEFYLKSEDEELQVKAIKALILGGLSEEKLVTPNKERGVELMKAMIEKIQEEDAQKAKYLILYFNQIYSDACMYQPVIYDDNDQKTCIKPLTIEDLGEYYIKKYRANW